MGNFTYSDLYKKTARSLLNSKWLEKHKIDGRLVKKHVNSEAFKDNIKKIIDNTDYTCSAVLSLCKNLMEELSPHKLDTEWLFYIYQYALSKSFPRAVAIEFSEQFKPAVLIYLNALRSISNEQKFASDGSWQSIYPLLPLTPDEEKEVINLEEYKAFLKALDKDYVYEMMKLHQEITGFNTLDHINGVQYLALYIGRQLKNTGIPVDLGRVFGSAVGHDIGKYGCKDYEYKRVPYLHYYYTDEWFRNRNLPYIGHIAVNHSTWDLELENLPIESLILIYCDFRVKNIQKENGEQVMNIYSLEEAFQVILQKLDNVDEKKLKRYKRVYAKLEDFESYMLHLGISTSPDIKSSKLPLKSIESHRKKYAFLSGQEIIDNIKYLSIHHNISLMCRLRDEASLNAILELARGEKDWKNLREYLRVFHEYCTYLTQKQKLIMLKFLYEQLTHPEDDIRKHCAELIGLIIAIFDEDYRKEVPEYLQIPDPDITSASLFDRYLENMITPDHKIINLHKKWIGYSLTTMVASLFKNCSHGNIKSYVEILLKHYEKGLYKSNDINLYLLMTAKHIPVREYPEASDTVYKFIQEMLKKPKAYLRVAALNLVRHLLPHTDKACFGYKVLRESFETDIVYSRLQAEAYLRFIIAQSLELQTEITEAYKKAVKADSKTMSDLFLSNLKSATEWVIKKINVEILLSYAQKNPDINGFHASMHFCNLLKVSSSEAVRNAAGRALVELIPNMSFEKRNEIAIELLRALEIDNTQFSEYIPYYLGQLILYLQPKELDEFIEDLVEKIKQPNAQLNTLLLKTVGIAIVNYPKYSEHYPEDSKTYNARLKKMLGIILNGMVHYDLHIKQVAFSVLGIEIFGSTNLSMEQRKNIFKLIGKKMLTLMANVKETELLFLSNAAGLSYIYRFISNYTFYNGKLEMNSPDKAAFFPGTFDPFSLSHKEIARAIQDMGFEVYLAVDEFSWSKLTLPHLLRRNIVNMSVADEPNIYLYPEDYPINIANEENLKFLRQSLPTDKIYIVVGSDVVLNASSYKKEKTNNSIHTFPHIIFNRKSDVPVKINRQKLNEALKNIEGEVIKLSLTNQYQDISSTQIRNYIDENRDISKLIDPLAQNYIYENGFYQREPQFKSYIETVSIDVEVVTEFNEDLAAELANIVQKGSEKFLLKLRELFNKPSGSIVLLRDRLHKGKVLAFSVFHWIRSAMLYEEFKSSAISQYIRENAVGRILLIDGIFIKKSTAFEKLAQIITTETIAHCLAKDYEYCLFHNSLGIHMHPYVYEILKLQGFFTIPGSEGEDPVLAVNMAMPCTLHLDIKSVLKEPFRSNENVNAAIIRCRNRLQKSLSQLYPGHLVLSFDRRMMHETLIKKICSENGVPTKPVSPRQLGPYMCVPFGSILKKALIPNTVTKSLHTEKLFMPDMKTYEIGPYPYYLDLRSQIKMIHSFNRPVILVDDLLSKGYRIKALDPLLKAEGVKVQKIIVGILSSRGKELMDMQNRQVDSAYFIPKLRLWFNESSLYPFIGGDALWRGVYPERNLLPSINLILPYTSPSFIHGATRQAIYSLSKTALENSIEILMTLEEEYQKLNEKNLTLASLGQVFTSPRAPEHGKNVEYNLNLRPSHYLLNDLELLLRLESIFVL